MSENTTWNCPSCGAINESKFCTFCGAPKPADAPVPESPVVAPVTGAKSDAYVSTGIPGDQPQTYVSTGVPGDQPQPFQQPYQQPDQQSSNMQQIVANAQYAAANNPGGLYGERSPQLQNWKTSVPMAILGCLGAGILGSAAIEFLPDIPFAIYILVIAIAGLFWAGRVYPSLFSEKPMLTDSGVISALNLFFGGIIFGCIWNANLTKGKRGISWIVFLIYAMLTFLTGIAAAL